MGERMKRDTIENVKQVIFSFAASTEKWSNREITDNEFLGVVILTVGTLLNFMASRGLIDKSILRSLPKREN